MPYIPQKREYRNFAEFEQIEQDENKSMIIKGLPILFDVPTVLFEENGIEFKEVIAKKALDGCDMGDFIFNRNHGQNDGTVFARTRNGSLRYLVKDQGLNIEALLDCEDERHRNLYRDIQKGRVDKMSFSFVARECSYDEQTHTRTILKIRKLYDVSAVDFPAYAETNIHVARDYFSMVGEKEIKESERENRRRILIVKTFF